MTLAALAAQNAAIVGAAMLCLWLLSLRLSDASIVDIAWGAGFALVAIASALGAGGARRWLLAGLVGLWGLRLSAYLAWRNLGHGEDKRYAAMRAHHGARFWWVSLFSVFLFQGALVLVISLPVQAAPAPLAPGWNEAVGVALFALGLSCECIADLQLARFKADPASAGQVMDRGLWRYSRHPNYFGDACVWWGLYLVSAAWWTAFAPALMTFLLVRVSGVSLLERTIVDRRPGYRDYIARTSPFIPWPPRRSARPQ
jgi:steroid 5-alpha reductase family enzyme